MEFTSQRRISKMSDAIELKSIHDLKGMNFYIPKYQRGYRWTEQQVLDLLNDIKEFIDDNYAEEHSDRESFYSRRLGAMKLCDREALESRVPEFYSCDEDCSVSEMPYPSTSNDSLDDRLKVLDESFSEMLLRKIDEKGMTDAQCYKKANIDRKLFSKIRSNPLYRPGKTTAVAFAIALELSLKETEELLKKAGFALSHSNKFDIIIEFFIQKGNYNIYEINEALFAFDQCLLGA
jgi:hypothetical protein